MAIDTMVARQLDELPDLDDVCRRPGVLYWRAGQTIFVDRGRGVIRHDFGDDESAAEIFERLRLGIATL